MTAIENANEVFSIPHHKRLKLDFEEINGSIYLVNKPSGSGVDISLNEWSHYNFPVEYEGFYTKVKIRLEWNNGTIGNWTKNVNDIATYTVGMSLEDATLLRSEDNGTKNIYIAISANKDKLYFYQQASAQYYALRILNVISNVPELIIQNDEIVKESLSFTDSLCASDYELRYGKLEARCFKITIAYDGNQRFKNRWFVPSLVTEAYSYQIVDSEGDYIVDSDGNRIVSSSKEDYTTTFPGYKFKVFSEKIKNDRRTRELICYDYTYDIMNINVSSWFKGLTFPMTLKNFRDSFFNYINVEQEDTTLINDAFYVRGHYGDADNIIGKTIIESICELNGVFGRIGVNASYEPKLFYESIPKDGFEYKHYVDNSGGYEDYVTDYITGVGIIGEDGTFDVATFEGDSNENPYIIRDNPIVYGAEGMTGTVTAMQNLYNKIKGVSYRPFTVSTYGIPILEPGTSVVIRTKNKTINSIVMSRQLTGIQSMKDQIEAYGDKKMLDIENLV